MLMMDSGTLENDSDKHLCISIPETNPKTFDDINNNHYEDNKASLDCDPTMKENILSSTNHQNDTTLLTTTTTTTTVEVKVKTTKTSSRKRKLDLNNHDNQLNKQATITKKKKKARMSKLESDERKNNKKSIDQSSGTDESSFGSCEPGTSVVLQGIVWNETDKGVLVVNITWRGKTYVGALLNTTEQNWAPPRYKTDIRSTKPNPNREHPLTFIPPVHESTERILRNGKRRGSSTTVTPSSTTKTRSFKIPDTPLPSKNGERSITRTTNEKILVPSSVNLNDEEETGDNDSSRSVSPTTSGISTTSSSSPPLSNINENSSTTIPMDLSNSKSMINDQSHLKDNNPLIPPYHFSNDMLFPSSVNPSDYLSSTNSLNLPSFNKLSSSSYHPITSQLYFNSLTSPHYSTVSSLTKSSR